MKNKLTKSLPQAFSLIELSIVILIIGILVAGVTQSSRLITQMKLASARTQTESAPVNSITGLLTWLEATSEASFDPSETEDASIITNWYDVSKQSTYRNHAQQPSATTSLHPTYRASCINGLPCVRFNGSTNYISTLEDLGITTELTIFVVMSPDVTTASTEYALVSVAGSWTSGTSFTLKHLNGSAEYQLPNSVSVNSPAISATGKYVIAVVDNNTTATVYSNKVAGAAAATAINKSLGVLNIGAWYNGSSYVRYFDGDIGEIIIFNRALKNEERQSIENYLSKKWGI